MLLMRWVVSTAAILFLTSGGQAIACTFAAKTLSGLLDQAEFVMIARVDSAEFRGDPGSTENTGTVAAHYSVVDLIKGSTSEVLTLVSGFGFGDCGVGLAPGHYFLVIADSHQHVGTELGVWMSQGSEDLGIGNPFQNKSDVGARITAIRNYVQSREPLDVCFDWVAVRPPMNGERARHCAEGRNEIGDIHDS